MSHIPAKAMHHAKAAPEAHDERASGTWRRPWLIGGLVAIASFVAVRAVRAAA